MRAKLLLSRICEAVDWQQHLGHLAVAPAQVHAADEVGLVLPVGQPAGRTAAGTAFRQHEDRRAARIRAHEGIGMDRDEQIGLHAACLLHPNCQRHEKIRIPGQERTHIGFLVQAGAQTLRNRQHHVLFACASFADGARIFAAVAGIDGHGDQSGHGAGSGARAQAPPIVAVVGAGARRGAVGRRARWNGRRAGPAGRAMHRRPRGDSCRARERKAGRPKRARDRSRRPAWRRREIRRPDLASAARRRPPSGAGRPSRRQAPPGPGVAGVAAAAAPVRASRWRAPPGAARAGDLPGGSGTGR